MLLVLLPQELGAQTGGSLASTPIWPYIAAGVLVLAAGLLFFLWRRRSKDEDAPTDDEALASHAG